MNEALQHWRENFSREPDAAFDRLVCGLVPMGASAQLSLGEILDTVFEPEDAALDAAAARWLEPRILGPLPEGIALHRWVFVLEEFFRGIGAMELRATGELLRREYPRLRLWLHSFYEGPDRDPEGAYLLALARAQRDQQFSPLWRRLILAEELPERPYLGIGIFGFRKMPTHDVPEGLLRAIVALAERPGMGRERWKQIVRSLFAGYRRNEKYWLDHLAPLLPDYREPSHAREWLTALLPGVKSYQPPDDPEVWARRTHRVPIWLSREWAERVRREPRLCDTAEFRAFLDDHRDYAEMTGDSLFINKTFNNLSTAIIRADRNRARFAISLMEEALAWAPSNPRNWTTYALTLSTAGRESEALDVLWQARGRFPWDPVIRNELGRTLRELGDLSGAEAIFRETVSQFPNNDVCRTALGETLREMGRLEEARAVFEQARDDFPNSAVCRNALGKLLAFLGELDAAELVFREAQAIDRDDEFMRRGLARVLKLKAKRDGKESAFREAQELLRGLAEQDDTEQPITVLANTEPFAEELEESEPEVAQPANDKIELDFGVVAPPPKAVSAPSRPDFPVAQSQPRFAPRSWIPPKNGIAERLGHAMIALWQAERTEDPAQRVVLCDDALSRLDVPERDMGELLASFVETRGLLLLARGDAPGARAYFEEQIRRYGRAAWIGVRLGLQRARLALGETGEPEDEIEMPDSQSTRFALHVARVIRALAATASEVEVRELLKTLYPKAAEFAAQVHRTAQGTLKIETGAQMLGSFLESRWFHHGGIQTPDDLDSATVLQEVMSRVRSTQTETFSVLSAATHALLA